MMNYETNYLLFPLVTRIQYGIHYFDKNNSLCTYNMHTNALHYESRKSKSRVKSCQALIILGRLNSRLFQTNISFPVARNRSQTRVEQRSAARPLL